jgi:hypothetical protein
VQALAGAPGGVRVGAGRGADGGLAGRGRRGARRAGALGAAGAHDDALAAPLGAGKAEGRQSTL